MEKIFQFDGDNKIEATFIHIPKTGGTTITKLLWDTFRHETLNRINERDGHHVYLDYLPKSIKGTPKFCVVRNPITWYESLYKCLHEYIDGHPKSAFIHKRKQAFNPVWDISYLYEPDFSAFISNMLRFAPNYYYEVCSLYMGDNLDKVEYVGHTETLLKDLADFLTSTGFKFDRNKIMNYKPQRVTKHLNSVINWKHGQKEAIINANTKLFTSPHFKIYLK